MNKIKFNKLMIKILSVLIVCLIVAGMWSYISYNNEKPVSKEYEELAVDSEVVQKLYSKTRVTRMERLFYGTEYYNIYYKNEVFDVTKSSEQFKKYLSYMVLDNEKISYDSEEVTFKASDLKQQYIDIFGNTEKYIDEDIVTEGIINISYNSNNDYYIVEGGSGSELFDGYKYRLIEARKYKDKIEIYEQVVFYNIDSDYESITYYTDLKYNDVLDTMTGNIDVELDFNQYNEKLNKYKYTFTKQNDDYYFTYVEKVK